MPTLRVSARQHRPRWARALGVLEDARHLRFRMGEAPEGSGSGDAAVLWREAAIPGPTSARCATLPARGPTGRAASTQQARLRRMPAGDPYRYCTGTTTGTS